MNHGQKSFITLAPDGKDEVLTDFEIIVPRNIWGQCYKTFYHGNLLPFHGNTIILCYQAILPW
jgi:hypothetical protein